MQRSISRKAHRSDEKIKPWKNIKHRWRKSERKKDEFIWAKWFIDETHIHILGVELATSETRETRMCPRLQKKARGWCDSKQHSIISTKDSLMCLCLCSYYAFTLLGSGLLTSVHVCVCVIPMHSHSQDQATDKRHKKSTSWCNSKPAWQQAINRTDNLRVFYSG